MGNQRYSTTSGSELVSTVPDRYRSLYRTGVLVARTYKPLYCSPSAHDDVDAAGLVWSFAFAEFRVWSFGFRGCDLRQVFCRCAFCVSGLRPSPSLLSLRVAHFPRSPSPFRRVPRNLRRETLFRFGFWVLRCGFATFAKSSVVARLEFRVFHSRQVPFVRNLET